MAAPQQRHLKAVEGEPVFIVVLAATGERLGELSDDPFQLADQLAGAQTEINGWRTRYANLKRDKDREARRDERWPRAKEIFDYWRQKCNHPRSQFDADRFYLIAPFIDRYGVEMCKRAIDGAAYDPFTKRLKNGAVQRYDSIELIFRNADKFESFCNRAPRAQNEGGAA